VRRSAEVALVERRYRRVAALRSEDGTEHRDAEHRKAYAPSPWRLLSHLLPVGDVGESDVFADFGCGKGRILLEATERYPFKRVIGIEVDPRLADAARELMVDNEARLNGRAWEVVITDVRNYAIPDDLTVAYFFDPFTGPVFEAVISSLEASVRRCPRRVRIVYLVPSEITSLHARVTPVRRGTAGWLRTGGRYEYFVGDLISGESTD